MSHGGGSSLAVTASAIIGLITGLTGTSLSLFNFFKARKKEKKEAELGASRDLVKAQYRKGQTRTGRPARNLFVINTDTRAVTAVHVDFYGDSDTRQPATSVDYASLGVSEESFVHDFIGSTPLYTRAEVAYTDADGNIHKYPQTSIPR